MLALVGGRRLALRRPKLANRLSILAVTIILFHLLLYYNPPLEYALFPVHFYMYVRPWWMPVSLFFLLGLALGLIPERRKRIAIGALAGVLGVFYVLRIGATAAFNPDQLTGEPTGSGLVCRQTTGYSCGAAAASTLLAQVAVPSTEREMAILCGTNGMNGTDVMGVMWGLREKLAGTPYSPRSLAHVDLAALRNLRHPTMAVKKLTWLIDHWIVVVRVGDDGILVADPLRDGLVLEDPQVFMQSFRGIVVTLDGHPAPEPVNLAPPAQAHLPAPAEPSVQK